MTRAINKFQGETKWLSNFWMAPITIDDRVWPSTEHYYQAMKFDDFDMQEQIRACRTPGQTKRKAKAFITHGYTDPNWDDRRVGVMRTALEAKFDQHPSLAARLVMTGDAELIEGNTWGDTFWGVCRGEGENMLGKLLMEIRADHRKRLHEEVNAVPQQK